MNHFNPLPPHGGRPHSRTPGNGTDFISIHSLRMEGDFATATFFHAQTKFQSTPSAWRETTFARFAASLDAFQSTPSAWRET